MLRQIEDVNKVEKIRIVEIKRRLKITVIDKISKQKLIWFGHIIRIKEERFVKTI